ncbi:unnamed protein product [Nezara viridula]|uniref:Uncharacterized protein n=1 Tax=Nezara viridula TaxID=85310 RepID=A0A9P0E2X4_NEZVI|nr:unnamed protein product [Nezara viridula]
MFSNKKIKTEEEKEKIRFMELEAAFEEEEYEYYYVLKEASRKVTELTSEAKNKNTTKLHNSLFQIVENLGAKLENIKK